MLIIDIGDLALTSRIGTKQQALFDAIQEKIVTGLWPKGGQLPSTRRLSHALVLSRNTVVLCYEQLMAEGYIESRPGSGFYVSISLPEQHIFVENKLAHARLQPSYQARNHRETGEHFPLATNAPFAPGIPDLRQFPYKKWQKLQQRHAQRQSLSGNQALQGSMELRKALADYLASSRSVSCSADTIIITSGAQQALSIATLVALQSGDTLMLESPGYTQMRKVAELFKFNTIMAPVYEKSGLDVDLVLNNHAKALYLTPSNQYPLGTTLNIEQRIQLIDWAQDKKAWIIEDDYDSEFQFAHQPYPSMQGLASRMGCQDRIFYIGSLSKVMFNGLRLGYLIVPNEQVNHCLAIKDALSGDTPAHAQAALADFIQEGDLLRHIRKMRRLYKAKYSAMIEAIQVAFQSDVSVISQAAGLHVTLKWWGQLNEDEWARRAANLGIIIRPLNYYESKGQTSPTQRQWNGAVLGFGNIALEDISTKINNLAQCFYER
jgi:GntR family transcriptional regulator/MocR family aminotransferase